MEEILESIGVKVKIEEIRKIKGNIKRRTELVLVEVGEQEAEKGGFGEK